MELFDQQAALPKDFSLPGDKKRAYVGIDNGVTGSIGIIFDDGTYTFCKTPTRSELNYTKAKQNITRIRPVELAEILSVAGPGSMVLIERPMVNPTRFKATVSALRSFEATITILETLGLPYRCEDSKSWQKALLPSGIAGVDLKSASLQVGCRLFPETRSNSHPDRDGMLIAQYCKQQYR